MKKYIGTKIISAKPMTRADAEDHLGRNVGGDASGDGYLVQYDGGYQSWSPKDVFDEAYHPCAGLTFGQAIEALKAGQRVARAGWNGKGMWLCLSPGRESFSAVDFWAPANRDYALGQGGAAKVLPSITMKTATGEIQMGWLASQSDMLAEDWVIVE